MPGDEIETRYCRYVEEVLNHHHLDRLDAYLAPDVVVHAPGAPAGLAGARQVLASYLSAFPDLHLTIDTLLALDGELLARLTASGTHSGPFLGVAPTGQRVSVCAFEVWRLRAGRCAEHWLQLDTGALYASSGCPSTELFSGNGRQRLAEARSTAAARAPRPHARGTAAPPGDTAT
jgi:predicted ester cyclase